MNNIWNKWLALTTLSFAALPMTSMANHAINTAIGTVAKPKNIIYIIGDGMGPAYTSAYRYYMDNPQTPKVENTIFDELLTGMASTYSRGTQKNHTDNTYVTDSAASATALSTGVKTYNQAVAVDVNDKPLQTLMEYAKSLDKTTGLVVTSQINHATPASFVAHNTYRYNYQDIADDYFDNRVNGKFVADLMFGGGHKYFIRDDRNIVEQFKQAGYQYFDQLSQLNQFDRLPALGIFARKGLGYAIDNQTADDQPKYRLKQMVSKALSLMDSSDKGYFLLIEGSMIDWCGHANDISCAMKEMDGLANTVSYLKDYINHHPDTLMVMTADHNTGGLSVGSEGEYRWKPAAVKQARKSMSITTKRLLKNEDVKTVWQQTIAMNISPARMARISKVQKQAIKVISKVRGDDPKALEDAQMAAATLIEDTLTDIITQRTLTGWTSSNHTGDDVQIFAHGAGKHHFNGHMDNTDIAKKLFELIKP
ncbi:MAG: alkaline phosphatase [Phenylobacterium sp.]|jgi:alkaline phosphatase